MLVMPTENQAGLTAAAGAVQVPLEALMLGQMALVALFVLFGRALLAASLLPVFVPLPTRKEARLTMLPVRILGLRLVVFLKFL